MAIGSQLMALFSGSGGWTSQITRPKADSGIMHSPVLPLSVPTTL